MEQAMPNSPVKDPSVAMTVAVDRVFRTYGAYCRTWNVDALYLLLNALHSLDDKVSKLHGRVFDDIPELLTLKTLRQYLHHEGTPKSAIRVRPLNGLGLSLDLMHVCLVKTDHCVAAIGRLGKDYRVAAAEAFSATVKDWGEVADINPCVFNCIARVYEVLQEIGVVGESPEFEDFSALHSNEARLGMSHLVNGAMLENSAQVERYQKLMAALYHN